MSESMTVDLTNFKDRIGNRVAPGRYLVLVEDAEPDTSRAGNPMINLWLRVQGGEYDGATIVDRLTMTEKALFRVVAFMQAIGLPTPKKKISLNLRQIIGKVLEIDVEDGEPYNGRVKSEVQGYLRASKGAKSEAADLPADDAPEPEGIEDVTDADADEGVDLDNVDLG